MNNDDNTSKQCIWMYTVWQFFVIPIGNDWHSPADISVIYYTCNVKVENKNNKLTMHTVIYC